jgi:hypothetical protein
LAGIGAATTIAVATVSPAFDAWEQQRFR